MERLGATLSGLLNDQVLMALVVLIVLLHCLALLLVLSTFLLRFKNDRDTLLWAQLQSLWEPLLFEVLQDSDQLNQLWEKVGEKDHLHFLEFVLPYAQRLEGAERAILQRAADPFLSEILPKMKHRRLGIRARAVQTVGTLGLPRFTHEIKEAVNDPSPFVAAIAGRLLAHDLGAEMASDLCRNLPRFKNFRIWYLVDMVTAMGPGAVPAIRETLENPEMPLRTRAVAAHALSVLRDLGAADLAATLTLEQTNPELLAALLRLLAQVGTPRHSSAARAHLDSDEFFVRSAATRTLSELGTPEDLPLLLEKLDDPSAWVRMAAARGVYRLGGKAALDALIGAQDPSTPLFRRVLAEESGR